MKDGNQRKRSNLRTVIRDKEDTGERYGYC